MNRIFGGLWLVGAGCAVLIGACGAESSEVGKLPDGGAGEGGVEGCEPGSTKTADDGCNSCSCEASRTWACTEIGCECESGETRTEDDGCTSCVCSGGLWQCDDRACTACTPGETMQSDCTSCVCTDFGDGPAWACTANACQECTPGSTRLSDDQCSTCSCGMDGTWQCPPTGTGCSAQCEEGQMKPAGDGCNTCSCFHGTWGCTLKACQPALVCEPGEADCDADAANGCETDIESSVMNCGSCGNYCAIVGAYAACVAGKCVLDHCAPPYADCNGDPNDGCEVPTGDPGCATRCDSPSGSRGITPALDDCQCPMGSTCVRNSVPGDGDLCYPIPEGCQDGLGTCGCLGSCVCPEVPGAYCTEQMTSGGFILDCDGMN
jgi:hypothetical protein